MPNLKVYVDRDLFDRRQGPIVAALPPLRDVLCEGMKVTPDQAQLVILPVHGLPDQPLVNIEFNYLAKPDRDRATVIAVCEGLRRVMAPAAGTHVAVRATALEPSFIALK